MASRYHGGRSCRRVVAVERVTDAGNGKSGLSLNVTPDWGLRTRDAAQRGQSQTRREDRASLPRSDRRGARDGHPTQRGWRTSATSGFTLVEVLVTILIAVILATTAVPAFQSVRRSTQATSGTNDFLRAANMARSEALSRDGPVRLCPSTDGKTCNSSDWTDGWVIRSGSGADPVLQGWDARPEDIRMQPDKSGFDKLSFSQDGSVDQPVTFKLKPTDCSGNQKRIIEIPELGQPDLRHKSC